MPLSGCPLLTVHTLLSLRSVFPRKRGSRVGRCEGDEPGTEEGRSDGTDGRAGLSLCLSITPSPDLDLKRFHCAPGDPGVYVRQGTLEYSTS